MSSAIEKLQYHLVFCTKYRYKLLTSEIAEKLREYLLNLQQYLSIQIVSLAIEKDHVHILFKADNSQVNLNKVVQRIKGSSSKKMRSTFTYLQVYPSLFTASHFLASVGEVSDATIADYISKQGIEEKEMIRRTYKYKVFDLNKRKKKQLDAWLSNFSSRPKGLQSGYQKKYPTQICLRNDLISLDRKKDKYWLSLPGGNNWKPIAIGLLGRELPNSYNLKDSKIIRRNNEYFAFLCIEEEVTIKNAARTNNIVAVDLGITHHITSVRLEKDTVKNCVYYGKEIKNFMYKRTARMKKLQSHGIKKLLGKKLSRYTRTIDNCIHLYTKQVIEETKQHNAVLVIGNIHNITRRWDKKEKKRNKTFRRKAKPTPYAKIMQRLFYKAALSHVQAVFLNEAYTSQRCSRCNELGTRNKDTFTCNCGYTTQADMNGGTNIALAFRRGEHDLAYQLGNISRNSRL